MGMTMGRGVLQMAFHSWPDACLVVFSVMQNITL